MWDNYSDKPFIRESDDVENSPSWTFVDCFDVYVNGNWVYMAEILKWDFCVEITMFLYICVPLSNVGPNINVL